MLKKLNNPLTYILLLALVLRLVGINHGFPFIFHPDEPSVVRSALGIRFSLNPKHFDWPHLFIYLNYFVYMGFAYVRTALGAVGLQSFLNFLWNDNWIFYFISRVFAATLGAFTVIPMYLAGKQIFNKNAGLLSALVFSLIPYHVWNSHYALIDVPMVFFLAWGVYFSARILKSFSMGNFALAGLFVGLAASTKYNGGLLAVMIPLAVLLNHTNLQSKLNISVIFKLCFSGITSVIGFLLGTPFALLDYKTFLISSGPAGALWQFKNVGYVSFLQHLEQFFRVVFMQFPKDFGYTFFTIFGLFFVYCLLIKRFSRELIFLYSISLFFLYYVSGYEKTRAQYFMIVYPFVVLVVGYFLSILNFTKTYTKLLFVLVFGIPLVVNLYNSTLLVRDDTRVVLYNWLKSNTVPTNPLYYDTSSVDQVMDMFKQNKPREVSYTRLLLPESYFISEEKFTEQKIKYMGVSEVFSINSYSGTVSLRARRGPDIYVYKSNDTNN